MAKYGSSKWDTSGKEIISAVSVIILKFSQHNLTGLVIYSELSLLRLAPRAATVSAIQRDDPSFPKLKVAALDAPAFTRLLGPLREIMERKAGERYGTVRLSR